VRTIITGGTGLIGRRALGVCRASFPTRLEEGYIWVGLKASN